MKKRIIIGVAAAVAVGILFWKIKHPGGFRYAGTVEATEVDVSSRLPSVIQTVGVKEGDDVFQGRELASLDCADIRLAADLAAKDFAKAQRLLKSGAGMTREAYDRFQYKNDDAKLKLSWCSIKAPSTGRVLYVYHEAGEWVMPGTKILTVADLSEVHAYVYVPQPMLARLAVGMEAKGYLPELGERAFQGKISRINDEAEFTPKNVQTREERTRLVYGIKLVFPNPDMVLKPGMTVEVELPD